MAADLFCYDESSASCVRWKVDRYGGRNYSALIIHAGTAAGCLQTLRGQRKWRTRLNGRLVFCHNIVWELHHGTIPEGYVVDHVDGDTENNRIGNLRLVTQEVNTRNAGKRKDNSSGVTGVRITDAGDGHLYWTATWRENGRRRAKHFPWKYGEAEAFRLACEYRVKMIEQLNAEGAGYTEDHGKR